MCCQDDEWYNEIVLEDEQKNIKQLTLVIKNILKKLINKTC